MYGLVTLLVGVLSSMQSRMNGQLAVDIHSGIGAAFISNVIGWTLLWVLVLSRRSERSGLIVLLQNIKARKFRWWELMGGVGGTFFLTVQAVAVPQVGVAIFTICYIGGQTTASLLVDKFGFSTNGKQHITWPRVLSAAVTILAVTVAVYPDFGRADFRVVTILLAFAVGVAVSLQLAINSRVNLATGRPLITTWLSFMVGLFFLAVVLVINLLQGESVGPLPHNIWVYLGGPAGVIFIAVASKVVKSMGVLNFVLFSVTGQLIGAILLDWLIPARPGALSGYLISGTIMTLGSIAFSRFYHASRR